MANRYDKFALTYRSGLVPHAVLSWSAAPKKSALGDTPYQGPQPHGWWQNEGAAARPRSLVLPPPVSPSLSREAAPGQGIGW